MGAEFCIGSCFNQLLHHIVAKNSGNDRAQSHHCVNAESQSEARNSWDDIGIRRKKSGEVLRSMACKSRTMILLRCCRGGLRRAEQRKEREGGNWVATTVVTRASARQVVSSTFPPNNQIHNLYVLVSDQSHKIMCFQIVHDHPPNWYPHILSSNVYRLKCFSENLMSQSVSHCLKLSDRIFNCPEQLNVTHSLRTLLIVMQKKPIEFRSLRHLIGRMRKHDMKHINIFLIFRNVWKFLIFLTFWIVLKIVDNFDNFWQFGQHLRVLTTFDNCFRQCWQFFLGNFDSFW